VHKFDKTNCEVQQFPDKGL